MNRFAFETPTYGFRVKAVKSPEIAPQALASGAKLSRRDQKVITRIVKAFIDRSRRDIDGWRNAVKMAENPETPRRIKLHDLYNDLKSDGHLIAQRQIRMLQALSSKFRIVNKKTGEEDQEKTRLFQTPWFYKFMFHALDTVIVGTKVIEFGDIEEGEFKEIKIIPSRHVVPEKNMILIDLSDDKGIDYSAPEFQPWMIEVGEKEDLGLMADIAQYLIWKKNAFQAWAEFTEKFGIPFRESTTNSRNPEDINRIEQMLEQMGSAGYGVFPEGTTLKIHDTAAKGEGNTFDKQIERLNSEISKAINGVTMLSDNGSSKAQGDVHAKINDKIIIADKTMLAFKINWDLLWLLNKHGYGLEGFEFQWDDTENLSKSEQWKIVNDALQHVDIPAQWISDTFGFPIEGKKVKQAKEPQPAPKNEVDFNSGLPAERNSAGPVNSHPLYDLCCNGILNQVPAGDLNSWEKQYKNMFQRIFDKKLKAEIPGELHMERLNTLNKAFSEGFKERLNSLDYDSPDNYRIAMMQANMARFSAAATWQEVLELNQLAQDSKSFSDFKEKAETALGKRLPHLEAEYGQAIAASQNAANWLRQLDDKDLFDLEYQTIGDERVRQKHKDLDGLVAPVDDPIWNTIYPPNGWNCRCEAVQVPKGSKTHTDQSKVSTDSVAKGFKLNFGKTNMIFEQGHAYFKEFPEEKVLSAKKYGRPDYVNFNRSGSPDPGMKKTDQVTYEKWWKKEVKRLDLDKEDLFYKNYTGISYRLNKEKLLNKWKRKEYEGQNRQGIASIVESILQEPDEVWLNKNSSQNKGTAAYRGVYLKNYNDGLYAVLTNTENENSLDVITWYKVDPLNKQQVGDIRNGLLIWTGK